MNFIEILIINEHCSPVENFFGLCYNKKGKQKTEAK